MTRKTPLTEEEQRLKDLIREAHEAAQALNDAIKQAKQLAPDLISKFEQVHHREIKQLSNYMVEEGNLQAARLNRDVEQAREMINQQLMRGAAVFDATTRTVTITWGPGKFDDNVPPPYPEETLWKATP